MRAAWFLMMTVLCGSLARDARAAEPQSFDSDGVRIAYTVEGEGPPVVLIHGYTANAAMNWRIPGVVKLLAEDYQVIALDNRGHGGSDKPRSVDAYGAPMAEDVIRLMDHLGIESAHLVGYSMGGMITLKLLTTHPERIRSAVVGGMGWLEQNDDVEEVENAEDLDPLRACRMAFGRLGITREELAAISVPTVVIIGTDDGLMARVDRLKEVRSDIPIVEIAEANHLSCIMKPDFRQAIKDFVDRQAGE